MELRTNSDGVYDLRLLCLSGGGQIRESHTIRFVKIASCK